MTTFGELGEGCVMVQEWLAMRYKAHLTHQPERPDGVKVATLVGNFRADFRLGTGRQGALIGRRWYCPARRAAAQSCQGC